MLHCRLCYCEELIIHHAIICEVYMQLVLFLMVHLFLKLLPGPSLIICVNINWFPLWSLSPPLSSLLLISYFWDVRHDNTSLLVFYVLTKCNTSGAPASPLQFSIYWSSCNSISSCCTLCWEVSWLERSVTFNLSHLCIVLSSTFQVLMRSGKKKDCFALLFGVSSVWQRVIDWGSSYSSYISCLFFTFVKLWDAWFRLQPLLTQNGQNRSYSYLWIFVLCHNVFIMT